MVKCDFNLSNKCRKEYFVEYRRYLKILSQNDNKIICLFCSRTLKFSGRNNPNTKYHQIDDNYFDNINSPDKAYILGWIASDGHIGKRGFKIAIHQKDIAILEYIKNKISTELPINIFKTKTSNLASLEVNSQKMSKDLCKLLKVSPGKKSNSINFPNLDGNLIHFFARGYFEGDGSINDINKTKYPYIKGNIRSNSKKILESFKQIYGGSISNNILCLSNKKMLEFLDKIYTEPFMVLKRKYDRYFEWKINSQKK